MPHHPGAHHHTRDTAFAAHCCDTRLRVRNPAPDGPRYVDAPRPTLLTTYVAATRADADAIVERERRLGFSARSKACVIRALGVGVQVWVVVVREKRVRGGRRRAPAPVRTTAHMVLTDGPRVTFHVVRARMRRRGSAWWYDAHTAPVVAAVTIDRTTDPRPLTNALLAEIAAPYATPDAPVLDWSTMAPYPCT